MDRYVRRAVVARFVTNTGAEAGFFIGMWGKAAYTFEADAGALAVMTVIITASGVVGNVVGGVAVDRFDARRVLISAEVALAPVALLLLLAGDLAALFAVGGLLFVLHGIEEAAATSLPPALVAPDDHETLVRVNANLEAAGWLALVAGPGLGGLLVAATTIDAVFVLDAVTSVASVLLLLTVRLLPDAPPDEGEQDAGTGFAGAMAGLRVARRTPALALAMLVGMLLWAAFGAFVALEPLYYRDVLGVGPDVLGYVNALFGVGLYVGSVAVGRLGRAAGFRHAVWLAAASGLGAAVYVGTSSLRVVLVGALLWAVPLGMVLPIVRTLAQRAAPRGTMGRVMGAVAMVQNLTSVAPAAVVPFLAAAFGVQAVLVTSGLLPVLALPLLLGRARREDQRRAEEPPPPVPVVPTSA